MKQTYFKDSDGRYYGLTGEQPKGMGNIFVCYTGPSFDSISETIVTNHDLSKLEQVTVLPSDWQAAFAKVGFNFSVPARETVVADEPQEQVANITIDLVPNLSTQQTLAILGMLTVGWIIIFGIKDMIDAIIGS